MNRESKTRVEIFLIKILSYQSILHTTYQSHPIHHNSKQRLHTETLQQQQQPPISPSSSVDHQSQSFILAATSLPHLDCCVLFALLRAGCQIWASLQSVQSTAITSHHLQLSLPVSGPGSDLKCKYYLLNNQPGLHHDKHSQLDIVWLDAGEVARSGQIWRQTAQVNFCNQ